MADAQIKLTELQEFQIELAFNLMEMTLCEIELDRIITKDRKNNMMVCFMDDCNKEVSDE